VRSAAGPVVSSDVATSLGLEFFLVRRAAGPSVLTDVAKYSVPAGWISTQLQPGAVKIYTNRLQLLNSIISVIVRINFTN
jgi:hypothetical protein